MSTWILVLILNAGARGPSTLGPFQTEAECQAVKDQMDWQLQFPFTRLFCIKVPKATP